MQSNPPAWTLQSNEQLNNDILPLMLPLLDVRGSTVHWPRARIAEAVPAAMAMRIPDIFISGGSLFVVRAGPHQGMEVEQCEDGCVLAAEGDEESRFFLVQFGTVACTRNDKEIKRLRPGQYFGESSVIGLETTDTYTCIGSAVVASVPPEVMMQFGDTVKQLLADGKVRRPRQL